MDVSHAELRFPATSRQLYSSSGRIVVHNLLPEPCRRLVQFSQWHLVGSAALASTPMTPKNHRYLCNSSSDMCEGITNTTLACISMDQCHARDSYDCSSADRLLMTWKRSIKESDPPHSMLRFGLSYISLPKVFRFELQQRTSISSNMQWTLPILVSLLLGGTYAIPSPELELSKVRIFALFNLRSSLHVASVLRPNILRKSTANMLAVLHLTP